MDQFLGATIGGLATGGLYAISASGLTLTYAATGVFNFAHGATGMAAAFLYWELRFNRGVPAFLAFVLVVGVVAPVWGAAVERLIGRRLIGSTETTKAVATLALLVALLSLVLSIWPADELRAYPPLFRGRSVPILGTRLSYNDLIVLALAAAVASTMSWVLHKTRAGVAMRATVDDSTLAQLNGSDPIPNARLAWTLGSALAALAGVLVASKTNLNATTLTLLIVNAYAAAVIGRLRSLPMTFAGGLLLGLAVDYGATYLPGAAIGAPYLRGVVGAIPVLVLVAALLLVPRRHIGDGDSERQRRALAPPPTWSGTAWLAIAVVAGTVALSSLLSPGDLFASTRIWGVALVGLSLVPVAGFAGKLSLAQLSFAGVGAMVAGHLGNDGSPTALIAAGLAGGLAGILASLPVMRLTGIYLSLATAAVAVALDRWLFPLPELTWFPGHRATPWGSSGTLTFSRPDLGFASTDGDRAFLVFTSVVFAIGLCVTTGLRRSRWGRQLVALYDSEAGAATVGLDARVTTAWVFAASGAMAGIGGALFGMAVISAGPSRFDLITGLSLVLMVIAAGVRSPGSAVVAGVVLGSPLLSTWADRLVEGTLGEHVVPLTIAGAAIGLGDNPNGFLPHLRAAVAPIASRPARIAAHIGALAGTWLLRVGGLLIHLPLLSPNGWWLLVSAGTAWSLLSPPRVQLHRTIRADLEWAGVDTPLSPAEVAALDRRLGLGGAT